MGETMLNLSKNCSVGEASCLAAPPQTLVAIDSRVDNSQILLTGVKPGVKAVIIDREEDAIPQITLALSKYPARNLQIVCHGEPGILYLGKTPITAPTMEGYSHLLAEWDVEDILLYACQVAGLSNNSVNSLLARLHQLTGANIAASTHRVGSQQLDGSWELDTFIGQVNSELALLPEVVESYPGVLATFGEATTYPTGGLEPLYVKTGDLNNDNIPDVVVNNFGSDNVSIFLGKGNGTFEVATRIPAGDGANGVNIGDFNKDGFNDIVVGNFDEYTVSVFLADGRGSFLTPQTFTGIGAPTEIQVADFNKDGNQDIVVTTQSIGNSIITLLGNGNGDFNQLTTQATGAYLSAKGDFNRDSILDLATTQFIDGFTSYVSIYLGNGIGGFSTPAQYNTGGNSVDVEVGDFNNDRFIDLVTTNNESDNISILLGNGNGTFESPILLDASDAPNGVAVADLNKDGFDDIAVTHSNSNNVLVFLGKGKAKFASPIDLPTGGANAGILTLSDLDGDNDLDIVVPNIGSSNISVVLNTSLIGNNKNNTLKGNNKANFINGVGGKDNLKGSGGNDTILGGGGNDRLDGNSGNDTLTGEAGNDRLNGGSGNDKLNGGGGNDILNGGSGRDRLDGSGGNDILNGGSSNDQLNGGGGNDILNGGSGRDRLSGNNGKDILTGGSGNDTILGGGGDDELIGGSGNDLLNGGSGDDKFIYSSRKAFNRKTFGKDRIANFAPGSDKIILDKTTFTSLDSTAGEGFSNDSEFEIVTNNSAASSSSAEIVYVSSTGNLYYNPNGSDAGFGGGAQFAKLLGRPALTDSDFLIEN